MKKIVIPLVLMLALSLTGCSSSDSPKENETKGTEQRQETTTTAATTDVAESTETTESTIKESENMSGNNLRAFPGSNKVADVKMGACIDGKQTPLCSVKIPTNYGISTLYMNEAGEEESIIHIQGVIVSDALANGSFEKISQVPSRADLTAPGDVDNNYSFIIADSKAVSIESEKEYSPDGIDITTKDGKKAYICSTSDQYDFVLIYELNDDWTLVIENGGQLKDELSLEEAGREFANLITPLDN